LLLKVGLKLPMHVQPVAVAFGLLLGTLAQLMTQVVAAVAEADQPGLQVQPVPGTFNC
jgi:hypothetical protein